uniref:Uncharacterized protein n=1 Tax=Arundo donax TaxID=35708 RepID=A0A0A8XQK1_ARUDO
MYKLAWSLDMCISITPLHNTVDLFFFGSVSKLLFSAISSDLRDLLFEEPCLTEDQKVKLRINSFWSNSLGYSEQHVLFELHGRW